MNTFYSRMVWNGILCSGLALGTAGAAQAETANNAVQHTPAEIVSAESACGTETASGAAASSADTQSASEGANIDDRLERQQKLLEKQSELIEKQQLQIDALQAQIEELRKARTAETAAKNASEGKESTASASDAGQSASEGTADGGTASAAAADASNAAGTENASASDEGEDGTEFAETEDPGPEPPSADEAPAEATAQASGQQPDMNPNISLSLLGAAKAGGEKDSSDRNTFYIQEAELNISAPVDPNTRLEACLAAHRDESPEVEEAFIQYMGLGGGLGLRAGKLGQEFGAMNSTHTHALPQIDRPLPYTELLGEHGIHTTGVEASYLLPLPWYSKITAAASTRAGGHEHEHEHEHEEEIGEGAEDLDFSLFPKEGKNNPLFTARWENLADLNEDTTLSLGLSYAGSAIDSDTIKRSDAYGADLTLKWNPTDGTYREFVWRSEYMKARQAYQMSQENPDRDLSGWYSYISYRLNRNFRLGLRYDSSDSAHNAGGKIDRASAFAEFIANEWNSLRLQYNHTSPSWGSSYNELLLQWNVMIGPHGAHKY